MAYAENVAEGVVEAANAMMEGKLRDHEVRHQTHHLQKLILISEVKLCRNMITDYLFQFGTSKAKFTACYLLGNNHIRRHSDWRPIQDGSQTLDHGTFLSQL